MVSTSEKVSGRKFHAKSYFGVCLAVAAQKLTPFFPDPRDRYCFFTGYAGAAQHDTRTRARAVADSRDAARLVSALAEIDATRFQFMLADLDATRSRFMLADLDATRCSPILIPLARGRRSPILKPLALGRRSYLSWTTEIKILFAPCAII